MVWEVKKLGDICEIELGKTPYRGNSSFWDPKKQTTNVWLSIADLLNCQNKIVSDSSEYVSDEGAKLSKIVKKGTLLVSFKLTLGRLAFAGRDLFTNEAIVALTIKNEKILSNHYLYYFLTFFDWNAATKGEVKVKGKTLNKAKLKQIEIILPSLQEQLSIVAILDKAFESITKAKENAEKNLKNAKEIFESYLQSVLENKGEGWEEKTLGDVCKLISGQHIAAKDYNLKSRGVGYITGPSDFGLVNPIITKWTEKPKVKVQSGDILITVKGSSVGKINLLDQNEIAISRQLMAIRVTKACNELIFRILSSKIDYFKSLSTGMAIPGISREQVLGLVLFIPHISEQKRIVAKLDALSQETKKLEAIYNQKLSDIEELKKSILQKAFRGELMGVSS